MTTKELKLKIIDTIEKMPEKALEEVFHYLNEIKDYSAEDLRKFSVVNKILKEDDRLLKKLAE